MQKLTRRRFVGAAGATCAIPLVYVSKAFGAEYALKYANNSPVTHPLNIRASRRSSGSSRRPTARVEIEVFPNNQLGSDTDMLSQLRSGAIEFFTLSGLILSTWCRSPRSTASASSGRATTRCGRRWTASSARYIRAQIAKAGLYAIEKQYDNGYRQMTSSTSRSRGPTTQGLQDPRPAEPAVDLDVQGVRRRAESINFSEVYSALQTKVAEGQENPLSIIYFAKLFEVQKYSPRPTTCGTASGSSPTARRGTALPADVRDVDRARTSSKPRSTQRADIVKQNETFRPTSQPRAWSSSRSIRSRSARS